MRPRVSRYEYFVLLAAGGRPSTWSPPGRLVEHDDQRPTNTDQRPTNDRPTTDRRPSDNWPTTDPRPTNDWPTDDRPATDRPATKRQPKLLQKIMPNHLRSILKAFLDSSEHFNLYHCPDQFRTEGCEALSFFLRQCECSVKSSCFLQYFLNLWILANASKILIGIIKIAKTTKFWVNSKFNEMHLRALESSFHNALIA